MRLSFLMYIDFFFTGASKALLINTRAIEQLCVAAPVLQRTSAYIFTINFTIKISRSLGKNKPHWKHQVVKSNTQ